MKLCKRVGVENGALESGTVEILGLKPTTLEVYVRVY